MYITHAIERIILHVAATAPALAPVRIARAAGAVAMARSVDFALDDNAVSAVVTVDK